MEREEKANPDVDWSSKKRGLWRGTSNGVNQRLCLVTGGLRRSSLEELVVGFVSSLAVIFGLKSAARGRQKRK